METTCVSPVRPVSVCETVYELPVLPVIVTETTSEFTQCPVPFKEASPELSVCPAMITKTHPKLPVCPVMIKKVISEPFDCSVMAKEAAPYIYYVLLQILDLNSLPVLSRLWMPSVNPQSVLSWPRRPLMSSLPVTARETVSEHLVCPCPGRGDRQLTSSQPFYAHEGHL